MVDLLGVLGFPLYISFSPCIVTREGKQGLGVFAIKDKKEFRIG